VRLRNLALAVALTLLLGAMPVSAAGYVVAASCTVAPLLFVFDGKSVAPQVANGNPAGFICNGTSYVPLRFVASALGRDVAWDGSTDTVTITTPATPSAATGASAMAPATPSPANYDVAANCTVAPLQFVFDGASEAPQVANGNPAGFICNGTSYVPLRFVASALGKTVAWDGAADTVTVTSAPATVGAATNSTYGRILVNATGMTLYLLTQDSPTFSACSGSCAALWPPLTVSGTPTLAAGLSGTLTTLKRADGTLQVVYDGMPLYRFAGDKQPGDANGQCYDGVWFVVKVGQTAPPTGSGGC
jgi:predicted lipoprotein with Yx(FWY)xxD motif